MRVLQGFKNYLGNSENWVYRMLSGMEQTENIIAAESFFKNNFYHQDFQYLEFPVLPYKKVFANRVSNSLHFRISRRLRAQYYNYISKASKAERIELVHSHFAPNGWRYHPVAKNLGVPHIISFYGYDYEMLPRTNPHWKTRYQLLFKEATAFICEGANGARLLENMGCDSNKIKVVHLGVDTDSIPYYQRIKKEDSLNLIQVASYREKKGHMYTVKAFDIALKSCPNMTLTLVGDGSESIKKPITNYISEAGLSRQVQLIDSIDYHKLYQFLKDFDVFIHPSCHAADGDCEGGAPIVLLDAQASGLPVISSIHCDIPEEVIDGTTGYLAKERNVDDLAQAISKFYHMDNAGFQNFSQNGREHVEKKYNSRANALSMESVYRELIVKAE